jgi:hypothetical protein
MLRLRRNADFPDKVKDAALDRSGGICECHRVPQLPTYKIGGCGCLLGPGNTFIEHIVPRELGGGNDISNAAALSKTCWRLKTDTYDLPTIAEAKRERRAHFGIGTPGKGRSPMRGGRASDETKRMDGRVDVRRRLTDKLVAIGVIDPAALAAAREE